MNRIEEINAEIARLREEKKKLEAQKELLELAINYQLKELEKQKTAKTEEIKKMKLEINEIMKTRSKARPFIRNMNDFLRYLGYHARLSKNKTNQIDILDIESKEIYGTYQFGIPLREFSFIDKNGKIISYSIENSNYNYVEKILHDDVLIEYNMFDHWLRISKYCETDEFAKKELYIHGTKGIDVKVEDDCKNGISRCRYFEYCATDNPKVGSILILENSKNGMKSFSINPTAMWYNTSKTDISDEEFEKAVDPAITFYRNQELINYVTEDFEKAFPGIKRFIKDRSASYKYLISVDPSKHTSEITEILNRVVDPECDFIKESNQKKKV